MDYGCTLGSGLHDTVVVALVVGAAESGRSQSDRRQVLASTSQEILWSGGRGDELQLEAS